MIRSTLPKLYMNPSLPPKPQLPHIDDADTVIPQFNELKLNKSRQDLPFTTIDENYTIRLFKEKLATDELDISPPTYLKYLSTSSIKDFAQDKDILIGYLLTKYKEELAFVKEQTESIVESQRNAANDLKELYTKKSSESHDDLGLIECYDDVDTKLITYQHKLEDFDHLQIQMFHTLQELSKSEIAKHYLRSASANESMCANLLDTVSSKTEQLDSSEIKRLLQDYNDQRYQWHMNKQYISKIESGMVIGLT